MLDSAVALFSVARSSQSGDGTTVAIFGCPVCLDAAYYLSCEILTIVLAIMLTTPPARVYVI